MVGFSERSRLETTRKGSGCENRTARLSLHGLKDYHYPNPDTLSCGSYRYHGRQVIRTESLQRLQLEVGFLCDGGERESLESATLK